MDLLIDTYGTRIGCSGERIVLSFPKVKEKKEYPIRRIDKIVVLRPASLTTHAVQLALNHDVDIVYLGAFGKPIGRFFSSEPKGLASLRRAQLETSNDPAKSFALAQAFVKGKCANQIKWRGKEYAVKRVIENQIQALARHFMGKESRYQAFDSMDVKPDDGTADDGR